MKKVFLFFAVIVLITSCGNKTATVVNLDFSKRLEHSYICNGMPAELEMPNGDIKKAIYPMKDLESITLTVGEKVKTKGITKDGFLIIDK